MIDYSISRRSAYIGEEQCVCDLITCNSILGIETLLYIDSKSGKLMAAEVIDGEWNDIDLEYAEQEYADVLAKARRC